MTDTPAGVPASKLPRRVVLAALAADFDLAELFCYEVSDTGVLLISYGHPALRLTGQRGRSVRVSQAQIDAVRKSRKILRLYGPAPEDTRAQDAPGRAEAPRSNSGQARPCDEVE